MSVSTVALGPNSYQIDYAASTAAELAAELDRLIVQHGWTRCDTAPSGYVYKSKNRDDLTYKYCALMVTATYLFLMPVETWFGDALNPCYLANDPQYGGKVALAAGQMFLFVGPRWLALTTRDVATGALNNGAPGVFGCFEFSRDNAEDTGSGDCPPFLWTNTALFFSGALACGYSPRTRDGSIKQAARIELATQLGCTGAGRKLTALVPDQVNVWNSTDWVLTLTVREPSDVLRGRVFGLKAFTTKRLAFLGKVHVKVNSDYLNSAAGIEAPHFVVPSGNGRVLIPA